MTRRVYVTNAIPFVNGDPHLGHALEFVQADVLARHHRRRGEDVRYLSGTDDHAAKNVAAAEAAGVPVAAFVAERSARFDALREPLDLSYDSFIRTSADRRHRIGVEALWRACVASGDLSERDYEGLYCAGCEAFVDGPCAEHDHPPERVVERNWFFRLSRYRDAIEEAIVSGRLQIEPAVRRNEVLALVRGGLDDFSASRSSDRAGGWGIPVPDDPTQTIYVWFDALANYITDLGYGGERDAYDRWWLGADERIHVIGKGLTRFHAVYWAGILLSAGEPLPTRILVHDYLTVDGRKIGKSLGNGADPVVLAGAYSTDALRWWFVRSVPRVGDFDFRETALAGAANELANGLGNLVGRIVKLAAGRPVRPTGGGSDCDQLLAAAAGLGSAVDAALEAYDLRAAADAYWRVVETANRVVSELRPWELARAAVAGDAAAGQRLDALLADLLRVLEVLGAEIEPFLPAAAGRIAEVLRTLDPALTRALFRKAA